MVQNEKWLIIIVPEPGWLPGVLPLREAEDLEKAEIELREGFERATEL